MTKTKVISTGIEKQPKSEAKQRGRNFYKPASITYAACSSALVRIFLFQMAYIISSDRMHK
jgi:hypothetical protein